MLWKGRRHLGQERPDCSILSYHLFKAGRPEYLHGGTGKRNCLQFLQIRIFFQSMGIIRSPHFLQHLHLDFFNIILMPALHPFGDLLLDLLLHGFSGDQIGNLFFNFIKYSRQFLLFGRVVQCRIFKD